MLQRIGVALTLRILDFPTYYADIQSGKFDLTSLQWVGINDPNHYYMVFDSKKTPPGLNRGFYSNPAMDRLVEAGMRTLDPAERAKIYAQVQQLAAEDLRQAARSLGRITGRVDVEDMLDVIFREFCIGK